MKPPPAMSKAFKRRIKSVLRAFGVQIQPLNVRTSQIRALAQRLSDRKVAWIVDVGANEGQYGSEMLAAGYTGRLISFEPLSSAHARLQERQDERWVVAPRMALGNADGEIEINVSANSVSSSILPMKKRHSDAVPTSKYCTQEQVPIARLETVLGEYMASNESFMLKIDTQGYEWEVLDGLGGWLSNVDTLQLELSIVELYGGQKLWLEYVERLERSGFILWNVAPGFSDAKTGQTYQIEAIFCRNSQR